MYVQILAKCEENPWSRARMTWLNTGTTPPNIFLCTDKPKHLGEPPWHLRLQAANYRDLGGTGERGGDVRAYEYKLEVELTPDDLEALLNFALEKGLVEASKSRRRRQRS